MGSSLKSSNSHSQRGNTNNKPFAVMLLLAFGAAILGVMVLHKLREKRIFTLLVQQKDHELLTLHLLFQREKEFNQEARKKIEEMKNKVYSLRTQKLELDRRQLEMESTVSALKDERKVIELTLEEKRDEIRMLTAAMNLSAGYPTQVPDLKSMIKMKDREIEDQKLRLRMLDVKSQTMRVDTTETSANNGKSQLSSGSFSDSTKGESRGQNDGIIQREDEHLPNVEPNKLGDVKDATAIQRGLVVHLTRENIGNEERQGADFKSDQDGKVEEEKSKVISGNDHEEEQQKLKENGSRVKRRHSKGKRREALRNKRLGDDLYSVSKSESTPALTIDEQQKLERNEGENGESESEKEFHHKFQFERSENYQNTETKNDGQSKEEEEDRKGEERERKSVEIKSNVTKAEHMDDNGKSMNVATKLIYDGWSTKVDHVEKNAREQIDGKINNKLNNQEANREQEKMHINEANKHEKEDEQGNEIANEEGEGENSEDAETRKQEIDREDIKRFSESDPDEEAEKTEF